MRKPSPRAWELWRPDVAAEVDEELEFHLQMRRRDYEARGLAAGDAERAARERFGDVARIRQVLVTHDTTRQRRHDRRDLMDRLARDVRIALRGLRRTPGFTAITALTLALGIGANAAIFSVVYHLLLVPLPYPDGGRIVMPRLASGDLVFPVSAELMTAWEARSTTVEAFGASRERWLRLSEEPGDTVPGALITPGFVRTLGLQPVLGRAFTADEARPGSAPVAMIGHDLWRHRYGGRVDVLGASIEVNGVPRTVVGVAPATMAVPLSTRAAPAVWLPTSRDSLAGNSASVVRLRPGTTREQATSELQTVLQAHPDTSRYARMHARVMRAQEFLDAREARTLRVLFAAVAVLLLVACCNVANLVLARAWPRRHEFAVQRALGAERARLVRQSLTENVLLGLLGGALGLLIAWQGLAAIVAMRPPSLEHLASVRLQAATLLWTVGISVATALLFGCVPALVSGRQGPSQALRANARAGGSDVGARRLRAGLAVAQLALSLVLLVGGGLLVRSYLSLQQLRLGFDPASLVSIGVSLRGADADARDRLRTAVLASVGDLPGVVAVAAGTLPGEGFVASAPVVVSGPAGGERPAQVGEFTQSFVTESYFQTARIPLLQGRTLSSSTAGGAPGEVVVNRTLAERLWPGGGALGARVRFGDNAPWVTVVGISEDVRVPGARGDAGRLQVYAPLSGSAPAGAILVRGAHDAPVPLPALRRAIAAVDPTISVGAVTTADAYLRDRLAPARFRMVLLVILGVTALVVATIGLYAVVAYVVARRTHEIGIRVALGAQPREVTAMIVREGVRIAAAGIAVGLVGSVVATRYLASMLHGIGPMDPWTFGAIALLFGLVTVGASYVPARRVLRTDPAQALRAE